MMKEGGPFKSDEEKQEHDRRDTEEQDRERKKAD